MKHKGLKRQGSLYLLAFLAVLAAAGLVARHLHAQAAQACTEYTRAFGENFDGTDFKDSAVTSTARWPSGPIVLPPLGSNFVVGAADSLGRRIYQCAAGDFDGDGYPDLIGLDISGEYTSPVSSPQSEIRLIRNLYPTNAGATPLFGVDIATSYDQFYNHTGPAAITVGDYNADGLLDFFFMRNSSDIFGYDNFKAAMYLNIGTATAPAFTIVDFTARFQTAGIYCYWAANHFASVNIDATVTGDADTDILVISSDRIYVGMVAARKPCLAAAFLRGAVVEK